MESDNLILFYAVGGAMIAIFGFHYMREIVELLRLIYNIAIDVIEIMDRSGGNPVPIAITLRQIDEYMKTDPGAIPPEVFLKMKALADAHAD